jgi:BirA family biotin operon repressor/biotin-[acetyl-CoA-carboxylase] ligase
LPYPPSHTSIGTPFIELQSIDSTNNYALAQVHAGLAGHGMTIFAHEQVAGKGQRGKKWVSSKGDNIALSIIIKPLPLAVAQQFQLSVCMATALCEFFKKYAGEDTRVKWPNDLYWKDRKAGGILIENIIGVGKPETGAQKQEQAGWQWAVIGIGININQTAFPAELINPVSLKQITGKNVEPIELAKELCVAIDHYYTELVTNNFEKIMLAYLSHFYKKDEKVKLRKNNRLFEAVIKGITPEGKLIVQHAMEEQFDFGEIEWVI